MPLNETMTGPATDWDEETLAALLLISGEDILIAKAVYRRLAPKPIATLLDAEVEEAAEAAAERRGQRQRETTAVLVLLLLYLWDRQNLVYVNARTGKRVSQQALKQSLNTVSARAGRELQAMTRTLTTGELTLAEWQRQVADFLKSLLLIMQAAARGGWAQLDEPLLKEVGAELRFHLTKLQAFAKQIAAGRLTADAAVARADLYGAALNGSYEGFRIDGYAALTGVFVEVQNVLGQAEHCTAGDGRPGCVEETERGWVPLGKMSVPGRRNCMMRCKCRLGFRIRRR